MISLLFTAHKYDFVEMGLHHFICLILYVGCYMLNLCELSAQYGWIHDVADVPLALTKIFSETHFSNMAAGAFIVNMLAWSYTRCFALVFVTFQCLDTPNPGWHSLLMPTFVYYSCCLIMLHYYWWSLFYKLLHKFVKYGDTEDTIGGVEVKAAAIDNKINTLLKSKQT